MNHETEITKFEHHKYLSRAMDQAFFYIENNQVNSGDTIEVKVSNQNKTYTKRFSFIVEKCEYQHITKSTQSIRLIY